jgi:3-phosphoglycerate kinase
MNYKKKTIRDFDPRGKRVLLRCDFNVPMDKQTGEITSDKRIRASLATIQYLLERGAAVVACSHLGKPKGVVVPELSLAPVAKRLGELLGKPVAMAADTVGESARTLAAALRPGEIMLLENTRFEAGETKNDPAFAEQLASLAEIFVSDAFGAVHRAHASTVGVAAFLPAYAGLQVEKEVSVMGKALTDPARPFVAILGGAKISDKLDVIRNLLEKADTIIIGGGMCFTFLKSMDYEIGDSLLEEDKLSYCADMMKKAGEKGVNLLLPEDIMVGDRFAPDCERKVVDVRSIPVGWMGMSIGPASTARFTAAVKGAGTVVWNGPMGVYEIRQFSEGTRKMAYFLSNAEATTVLGGGSTAEIAPAAARRWNFWPGRNCRASPA